MTYAVQSSAVVCCRNAFTRPARRPSLNLEACSVDKRIARHREIDFVRPSRQSRRVEVENVSARATQRGVEAEVIIRV
jgi:hypothetical protein